MLNAKIRGTHPYSFRNGEWAQIVAVVVYTPEGNPARPAFRCLYDDGVTDYIAVRDMDNYEIDE